MNPGERPGPQPHNAGLTPGYQRPMVVSPELLTELQDRITSMAKWAKRAEQRLKSLEAEISRAHADSIDSLHRLIVALAERCAGQSEALARRAEGDGRRERA